MTKIKTGVTKEEIANRKALAQHLKYGDLIIISQITGTTTKNVQKYIAGDNSSPRVKAAFERLVAKRRQEFNERFEELTK